MAWIRTARRSDVGRRPASRGRTPERALVWVPTVFLACAGWAAFHDYGWGGWLALVAGGYLGRAVGDLAVGVGRPVEDTCEPRGRRRRV